MASTKADRNKKRWKYTDDNGTDWAVSADAVYAGDVTDGAKYGGSAAAATVPDKPRDLRMRRVACDGGGVRRWIPVYETTATLWTTAGTTVTRDLNGTDTVFTATNKHRGEKQAGRATVQTA